MFIIINNENMLAFESKRAAVRFLCILGDSRWKCDIREHDSGAGMLVRSDKALAMQVEASKMEWALK